jgi:Ca2+-binding EF-hand superfamily protein
MTILPLLKTTFVAAAILYSGVACAQAQLSDDQKQAALERMQAADTDQDGMIDKAEAEAKLPRIAKHFDKLDSNGDGKLSPEEFKATASKFAGRRR